MEVADTPNEGVEQLVRIRDERPDTRVAVLVLPTPLAREVVGRIRQETDGDATTLIGLVEEDEVLPDDLAVDSWLRPPYTVATILDAIHQAGGFGVAIVKGRIS